MFRPSRPMMRPFMSSEGSSTSETVVSAAWLAATRWSASATRLRARRFGLGLRLLLDLPDAPRQLVADELLGRARAAAPCLVDGHPGDPLELGELAVLRAPSAPPGAAARGPRGRRRPARGASSSSACRSSSLLARRACAPRSCIDLGAALVRARPRSRARSLHRSSRASTCASRREGLRLAPASSSSELPRLAAAAAAASPRERRSATETRRRPPRATRPIDDPEHDEHGGSFASVGRRGPSSAPARGARPAIAARGVLESGRAGARRLAGGQLTPLGAACYADHVIVGLRLASCAIRKLRRMQAKCRVEHPHPTRCSGVRPQCRRQQRARAPPRRSPAGEQPRRREPPPRRAATRSAARSRSGVERRERRRRRSSPARRRARSRSARIAASP